MMWRGLFLSIAFVVIAFAVFAITAKSSYAADFLCVDEKGKVGAFVTAPDQATAQTQCKKKETATAVGGGGGVGSPGADGADGADGAPGADGLNSLVTNTPEDPGVNCANGGTKVETGLDQDGSGVLEAGEVENTFYVCKGDQGDKGDKGDKGDAGGEGIQGK